MKFRYHIATAASSNELCDEVNGLLTASDNWEFIGVPFMTPDENHTWCQALKLWGSRDAYTA